MNTSVINPSLVSLFFLTRESPSIIRLCNTSVLAQVSLDTRSPRYRAFGRYSGWLGSRVSAEGGVAKDSGIRFI